MPQEISHFKKFVDWVNADTGLPPIEEREAGLSAGHDADGHDDHGSHDAHGDAEGLGGLDDFGGLEDFDMASISEDEEDEELDNTKMLVDTLQSMGGFAAPPKTSEKSKRPPSPLLKEGLPRSRAAHVFFRIISMALMAGIIVGLLITVAAMPPFGSSENPAVNEVIERYIEKGVEETGAVNIVSAIVLDYRAFDTLGETIVLFATMIAIIVLIRISPDLKDELEEDLESDETPQPLILKYVVMILLPFVLVYGFYILLNGHISPGGGFSGGALLGGGISLYVNAFGPKQIRKIFSFKTFATFFSFGFILYNLTKVASKIADVNNIEIPLGTPGNLFSGGLVLPLNIFVGIVVASAVYGLYALFSEGEV